MPPEGAQNLAVYMYVMAFGTREPVYRMGVQYRHGCGDADYGHPHGAHCEKSHEARERGILRMWKVVRVQHGAWVDIVPRRIDMYRKSSRVG